MSKAKTNKSHKERLNKFKTNLKEKRKKMNELQIPASPIENQYPVWNSKEKIEMDGIEFEPIYNILTAFRSAVMACESIMNRNLQNGKIKMVYKDKEGNDVPEDVVRNYQLEVQKFFEAQQAQGSIKTNAGPITAEEQKELPQIDAIVDNKGNNLRKV